jgi:hypothetical protein
MTGRLSPLARAGWLTARMTQEPQAVPDRDREHGGAGVSMMFMAVWVAILSVIMFGGLLVFIINVVTTKASPPSPLPGP